MNAEQKIVKEWYLRLLMDFKIYSPPYKIVIERDEPDTWCATATADDRCHIFTCAIKVIGGQVVASGRHTMYRGGIMTVTYKFRSELLDAVMAHMWDTPKNSDLAAIVASAAVASNAERARFHALAVQILKEREERAALSLEEGRSG